jgi:SAM-dependent methyltransferase
MLHCPCCGYSAEAFLPFGVVPRPNAMCPGCRSLERHRLLWKFFQDETDLFAAPLRVLHIAPEARLQRDLSRLAHLDYVSVDLESPLAMVRADITAMPFGDAAFDVILCSHVLEHVPDDGQAMREIRRVLRPGGWALLQSPMDERLAATFEDPAITDPDERQRRFGQRDHVRVYGRDYADRLRAAGFDVEVNDYASRLGAETRIAHALMDEALYLGWASTEPLRMSHAGHEAPSAACRAGR